MSVKLRGLFALCFVFMIVTKTSAQIYDKMKGGGTPDPQLSQEDNDFLSRQAGVFLDTIQSILTNYPPSIHEKKERGTAKLLMDAVFHEHFAVYRKPVQVFFQARIDQLIKELEETKVDKGVVIWKVYNMGFIARTKTVTLAFDLVTGITSGSKEFAIGTDKLSRIVRQCDALLITHRHPDHADKTVAEKFIELGLPVLAPDEVWKGDSIHGKLNLPERSADKVQPLKLKKYTLDMVVYPGHQLRSIENNVYLVKTPEGITLAHIGDQINEGDFMVDFGWIDQVAKNHHVDVLMPNAWTTDIFRIVKGFNPELVMPGHELELGHTVWDRLPYWGDDEFLGLNYSLLKKSEFPVVVTFWGESYHYYPKK